MVRWRAQCHMAVKQQQPSGKCLVTVSCCAVLALVSMSLAWPAAARTAIVKYQLVTERQDGPQSHHLVINGRSPAPTLSARVGDQLHIEVVNRLDEPVLLHWHGLLLPYDQDGVPGISSPPIAPGASREFRFAARQSGTYWYHSHTALQEQDGLYGAIVLLGDEQDFPAMNRCAEDLAVVLSDWDRMSGAAILRRLKKDSDWFASKKGTVQHWLGALSRGPTAVASRLQMSWLRMGAMDVSDVGYDRFLANGEQRHALGELGSGCVRLRVINAAASTLFDLEYAVGSLELISADGQPVEPVRVQRLRIGMGESYDLLLPTAAGEARELRATANDGSGWSSVLLGAGQLRAVTTRPRPDLYAAHGAHGGHAGHGAMANPVDGLIYRQLRARTARTEAERRAPDRVISLRLTGAMENYVWSFNNVIFSAAEPLEFVPGELLRIELLNETMMDHPIHLHGHFFRVLNGQGDRAPLKHTVVVPPMQQQTIELLAVEPGRWIMHCHNLYHMATGMARAVSYSAPAPGTAHRVVAALPPAPGGSDHLPAVDRARTALGDNLERRATALERAAEPMPPAAMEDRRFWWRGEWVLLSNMAAVEGQLRDANDQLEWSFEHGLTERNGERYGEGELAYRRLLGRFSSVYTGYRLTRTQDFHSGEDIEHSALLGAALVLPLRLEAELEWDSEEGVILRLSNHHQLSERLSLAWLLDVGDKDDAVELRYRFSTRFDATLHYSGRYGVGGGIRLRL